MYGQADQHVPTRLFEGKPEPIPNAVDKNTLTFIYRGKSSRLRKMH